MTLSAADKTRFLEALRDDPEFLRQVRQTVLIADLLELPERLGFQMIEVLNGNDLRQMLRQHNPADIAPGVRRSFYLADLAGRVIDRQGNEIFLAAETSYTADQRDSDRVIRNAEFLTRFTGVSAVPVVASRHNDREVQRLVEAGTIRWFEFDQRDLSPQ